MGGGRVGWLVVKALVLLVARAAGGLGIAGVNARELVLA